MNGKIDSMEIGQRLRKLRSGRTRTSVARDLGIAYSALCKYESGERVPEDAVKVKLADYYGTTVQEIFFEPK